MAQTPTAAITAAEKTRSFRSEPEEGEVRLGDGLDDRRIGLAAGAVGPEDDGADADRGDHGGGEDQVLPERAGNEGDAVIVGELVVLGDVGVTADESSRHRPLVDAKLDDHPDVD